MNKFSLECSTNIYEKYLKLNSVIKKEKMKVRLMTFYIRILN